MYRSIPRKQLVAPRTAAETGQPYDMPEMRVDDLILAIATQQAVGGMGFTIEDIRLGVSIADKVEAGRAEADLVLLNTEYDFVRRRLATFQFTRVIKEIVEFADIFANARSLDALPEAGAKQATGARPSQAKAKKAA